MSSQANDNIIEVVDLYKSFERGRIRALNGADLQVGRGEFIAVMGPSGCGKSTLLHLIAALDLPDSGSIRVEGKELRDWSNLSEYRAREIGIVFQMHNLLPTLTASENVQVPMFEINVSPRDRQERAKRLLEMVDLANKGKQRPTELSGGERQRVAIARALANEPPILLADEPTGNLDSVAGRRVLDLLEDLRARQGLTIVLVTHDPAIAGRADRVAHMLDGRVIGVDVLRNVPDERQAATPLTATDRTHPLRPA